jgi:hypothetical protein
LAREGRIYVSEEVLLSDDGLEVVRVCKMPEGLLIDVRVSAEAGARLRAATGGAIGREAATLINSRVTNVARIMSAIGGPVTLMMGADLPRSLADEVAAGIEAKWPLRNREAAAASSISSPQYLRPARRRLVDGGSSDIISCP